MVSSSFFFFEIKESTTGTVFNLSDFEKELSDLDKKVFPQALSRTVNDVGAKAKTAAMRELAKAMGVKKKALKKRYFKLQRSNARQQNFMYWWSGTSSPLPLASFKGRGLKHRSQKGKQGYAASVLGKRKKYKFFEATMSSGHVGAFYRKSGSTHQKSSTGKRGEYPIKQAYGVSVPTGMIQSAVERAWNNLTKQNVFEKKLDANMAFYKSRYLKKGGR